MDDYSPIVGGIYHLNFKPEDGIKLKGTDTSRNKFFVVLGIDYDGQLIGYMFVNSTVNKNLSQDVKDYHYSITNETYPFLDHESQIDCSDLKLMSMERFVDSRNRGLCGMLEEEHLELVKTYVVMSPTSTVKTLRRFNLI